MSWRTRRRTPPSCDYLIDKHGCSECRACEMGDSECLDPPLNATWCEDVCANDGTDKCSDDLTHSRTHCSAHSGTDYYAHGYTN